MIRIIDNKKVEMTNDEYDLYAKILKSYSTQTDDAKSMFHDLFEVNRDGIIIFIKPPTRKQTSFEVFLFIINLFQQQHMRLIYSQVEDLASQMKVKMQEIDAKLAELNKKE